MSNPNQEMQDSALPSTALTPPACSPLDVFDTPESNKNTYNKHQDSCPTSVVPSLICRKIERERDKYIDALKTIAASDWKTAGELRFMARITSENHPLLHGGPANE